MQNTRRQQAKYHSKNPLSRYLISSFYAGLRALVGQVQFRSVLEVGCGEGIVLNRLQTQLENSAVVGMDLNSSRVRLASQSVSHASFIVGSIFDAPFADRQFDLVICCEVLEHLEDPKFALQELSRLSRGSVILSVPNEPLWRMMNMARGAYWRALGNTPGHINHWSSTAFERLVSDFFEVKAKTSPVPWTLLLCRNA
jgi:2-polyprenyl-3-methyl-5-hydroxy-6-metoxy-1,4-benzoquinol methylase